MTRFLIVDDEPDVRFLLEANITAFGHEAVSTGNLDDARTELQGGEVEALILDVSMPSMDGPTFLSSLRAEGIAPDLVFLLSAIPPSQLQALSEQAGAHPVSKPFTSDTLRVALAPALN